MGGGVTSRDASERGQIIKGCAKLTSLRKGFSSGVICISKNSSEDEEVSGGRVQPKTLEVGGVGIWRGVGIPRSQAGARLRGNDRSLYLTGCGNKGEPSRLPVQWLAASSCLGGWLEVTETGNVGRGARNRFGWKVQTVEF